MQKKYQRKLVEADLKVIKKRLAFEEKQAEGYKNNSGKGAGCSLFASIPICAVGYLVAENKPPLWFPVVVILLIAIGFSIAWQYEKFRELPRIKERINDLKSSLDSGLAKVWNIQPIAFIELKDFGDDSYFIQVEENKVLFLGGHGIEEDKRFPTSDFDIIDICTSSGIELITRIEKRGAPLLPQREIEEEDPIREFIDYEETELNCRLEDLDSYLRDMHNQSLLDNA